MVERALDELQVARLAQKLRCEIVAEIENRVVGMAAAAFEIAELRACYVAPGVGRKGVGSALVKEIERAARERGLPYLTSDSSLSAAPFIARSAMKRWSRENIFYPTANGWPV
jgi:putative acetyltransferase